MDNFTSPTEELLYQARHGNSQRVEQLLVGASNDAEDRGRLDVNCKGLSKWNLGWSPLHLAAYFGHYEVAKTLIEKGADVNVMNNCGDTALHKAAYSNRVDVVTLLLNHDADVMLLNAEGNQPKQVTKNYDIQSLLEAAANVDERKREDQLLNFCRNGNIDELQTMISSNKPVNFKCTDIFGNTGLHLAAYRGHKEVVVFLLQNGINPNMKNARGQTPLEMARTSKMRQVLDVRPIKELQRRVQRYEGPLFKKSKIFGWRNFWIVLERGVMSYFACRADGSTGFKRKNFKYLDDAEIMSHKTDRSVFILKFSDDTIHTLSISDGDKTALNRQKWFNAFKEHIDYSTYYTKVGSNYIDDEMDDFLPLGSMQEVLKSAHAHQQVLEKHVSEVSGQINTVLDTKNHYTTSNPGRNQVLVSIPGGNRVLVSVPGRNRVLMSIFPGIHDSTESLQVSYH